MPEDAPAPLSDQIRAAVDASGRSRESLCRESGVDPAVMSKFMAGIRGLSMPSLDALAAALGLSVTTRLTRFSRPARKRKGD